MSSGQPPSTIHYDVIKFLLHAKQEIIHCSAELGLSSMQAYTLLLIDNEEPRSMNYYGKLYECDASNITGIMDGLVLKKLVSRQESATDRRVKVIRLEAAGVEMKSNLLKLLATTHTFRFSGLTDIETAQFAKLISKLSR